MIFKGDFLKRFELICDTKCSNDINKGLQNYDNPLCLSKNSECAQSSLFLQQKTWKWKDLRKFYTLEGKIKNFKTLAISKIINLASVTVLPNSTLTRPNKIYKEFIGNHKRPKIKEKTLITNFDKGGLKDVLFCLK